MKKHCRNKNEVIQREISKRQQAAGNQKQNRMSIYAANRAAVIAAKEGMREMHKRERKNPEKKEGEEE